MEDKMEKNKQKHDHHQHELSWKLVIPFVIALILYIAAFFVQNELAAMIMNLTAIILAGYHVIYEGVAATIVDSIRRKRFVPNVHILMLIAAIGTIIIGEYSEATLLILIFAGADYLEAYAQSKSKKEISKLLKLQPVSARKILDDGSIEIVKVEELKIGDRLKVLNGDQVPTDGLVIAGNTTIDEASITGESMPVDKQSGDLVFGSTINGNGTITIEVTKNNEDTVFAKILKLVSETQGNISKTAAFIKRFEPKYVVTVLLFTPLFYILCYYGFNWTASESFVKTMVFLMVASPCALAVTDIPASLSAISNLARRGILFKGASYLSNLADVKAVAFDKTGTLTQGIPKVTDVVNLTDGSEEAANTNIIANMERYSNHPLAKALLNKFKQTETLELEVENILGVGLRTIYESSVYLIAKSSHFKDISEEVVIKTNQLQQQGKTVIYFVKNDRILMLIGVADTIKETSAEAITYLKEKNIHTVMITGDSIVTGRAVGAQLGIDEVVGNVLPEQKSEIIERLQSQYGTVAMLGDGVNDAPALVKANIGIAMGDGTDIAIDVADGVLMKSDLTKLIYTYEVARKLRRVVWQNIIFAMSVVLILIIVNLFGHMNMTMAVSFHEGSTLIVILSGLRMLRGVKIKSDPTANLNEITNKTK